MIGFLSGFIFLFIAHPQHQPRDRGDEHQDAVTGGRGVGRFGGHRLIDRDAGPHRCRSHEDQGRS